MRSMELKDWSQGRLTRGRNGRIPRPLKGSKKWNPLIIPWLPQCSNGFILGGFHFLDPLGGLGREYTLLGLKGFHFKLELPSIPPEA